MPARRFVLVVNPRGGTRRGLAVLQRVKPVFEEAGAELEVRITEYSGHAKQIAKTMDLSGYDGFCVIGGDGTVHEVAGGLMQRGEPAEIPLGLIPAGTGNTLHHELRCGSPIDAVRRILEGRACPLDVARVTMGDEVVYCVNIIGWGGIADINGTAERLRLLGPPRYALAALWHVLWAKRRQARLTLDGKTFDDKFLFVIACNTKTTGSAMKLAPRAEIGDGKIDVVVLRRASRVQMLKLFAKVFDGSHLSMPCIEYHQVRSLAIDAEGDDLLDLDGERKGRAPFAAEMLPAALRVFA